MPCSHVDVLADDIPLWGVVKAALDVLSSGLLNVSTCLANVVMSTPGYPPNSHNMVHKSLPSQLNSLGVY